MKHLSSAEITQRLSALDAALHAWEDEAEAKSLDAVSGNTAAGQEVAALRNNIERAYDDRVVLTSALALAAEGEAAADRKAAATVRATHLGLAKENAAHLVELAKRADATISALGGIITEIIATETKVWASLGRAGIVPSSSVVGRRGLSRKVVERVQLVSDSSQIFQVDKRDCAEWTSAGWRILLDDADAEELA
jgi:uncharacterized protein YfiM (DUF2279 family)